MVDQQQRQERAPPRLPTGPLHELPHILQKFEEYEFLEMIGCLCRLPLDVRPLYLAELHRRDAIVLAEQEEDERRWEEAERRRSEFSARTAARRVAAAAAGHWQGTAGRHKR